MNGQDFGTVLKKYWYISVGTDTVHLRKRERGIKKEQKRLHTQILQKLHINEHQKPDLEGQLTTFINVTCWLSPETPSWSTFQ